MPETVLNTIMSALDTCKASSDEIIAARQWLQAFASTYLLSSQELAEAQVAIAASELEEAQGFQLSLEQVEQELRQKIANYKPKKTKVSV